METIRFAQLMRAFSSMLSRRGLASALVAMAMRGRAPRLPAMVGTASRAAIASPAATTPIACRSVGRGPPALSLTSVVR
jgi:hypothetical protein